MLERAAGWGWGLGALEDSASCRVMVVIEPMAGNGGCCLPVACAGQLGRQRSWWITYAVELALSLPPGNTASGQMEQGENNFSVRRGRHVNSFISAYYTVVDWARFGCYAGQTPHAGLQGWTQASILHSGLKTAFSNPNNCAHKQAETHSVHVPPHSNHAESIVFQPCGK